MEGEHSRKHLEGSRMNIARLYTGPCEGREDKHKARRRGDKGAKGGKGERISVAQNQLDYIEKSSGRKGSPALLGWRVQGKCYSMPVRRTL